MINIYVIDFIKYEGITFTDKEMLEAGYEAPITEDLRREYLNNLIKDLSIDYDDINILKVEN
jgi:hypothetical protein